MKMNVYLVQHAEAKSKEEDPQRTLSEKGREDAGKAAAFIAGQGDMHVDSILHSGKARARQTAEVLAEYLNPAGGLKAVEGLAPLDDPAIWLELLAGIEKDTMLVGHLPHMEKLASGLLCRKEGKKIVGFQPGGIVCLAKDEAGGWAVSWMVVPQILPKI